MGNTSLPKPRPARPYKRPEPSPARRAREQQYEEKRVQARQLFLLGMSYRDIAARIGLGESGYVTIARWVDRYGWKAEREALEQESKAAKKQTYLHRVSTIQEAHLRLAERVRRVAELALEGYIETDALGEITGIKVNSRTGLPAISPFAIQQLITAAADLERKALGVELLPTEEMAQLSAPTIEVTPIGAEQQELLRRMGDYLAQQSLGQSLTVSLPPAPSAGAAEDAAVDAADDDDGSTSPRQTSSTDAPPETVAADSRQIPAAADVSASPAPGTSDVSPAPGRAPLPSQY